VDALVIGGAIAWCLVAGPLVWVFWGDRRGRLLRLVGVAVFVAGFIVILGLVAAAMMVSFVGGT
jgi:hypothetical protein